jgi:sporulation protein YlmC with PRC-barrel domain
MRLSELLGARVVDDRGRSAGKVHDVRLVQDAPVGANLQAALRLDGLIVGPRAVGARLGYERARMHGPLLVRLLVGWLLHHGRYVPWDRVRAIQADRILISGSADDLPQPGPSR